MSFVVFHLPPLFVYSCVVLGFWDDVRLGLMGAEESGLFVEVWCSPGALTGRGFDLRRLPTGAAVR